MDYTTIRNAATKIVDNIKTIGSDISTLQNKQDIISTSDKTITNSHKGKLKIEEIGGKCEQETTNGKQLYNANAITDSRAVIDKDGWVTVEFDNSNGTSIHYRVPTPPVSDLIQTNKDYLLVLEVKEISADYFLACTSDTSNNIGQFVTDSFINPKPGVHTKIITSRSDFSDCSTMLRTIVGIYAGNKCKVVFRISILEDTTITDDTFVYEPYTGGQPSPNPDYPQEIKKVVVSEIKTHGKNFLNPAYLSLFNGNQYISCDYLPIKPSHDYTLSFAIAIGDSRVNVYDKYKNLLSTTRIPYNGTNISFTTEENAAFLGFNALLSFDGNVSIEDAEIQLEEGVEVTPYEPYTESSIALSQPIELNGIGDVQDTIEDGKVKRKFGVKVFNGSEGWGKSSTLNNLYYSTLNNAIDVTTPPLCSHAIGVKPFRNEVGYCFIDYSNGNFCVTTQHTTLTDFKSYLQEHSMTVVYELAEEVIEALPFTDQIALNSLLTYDAVTYLDFDSEIEPTFKGEYGVTEMGGRVLDDLLTGLNSELLSLNDSERINALESTIVNNIQD